jgi:hypothetical protein
MSSDVDGEFLQILVWISSVDTFPAFSVIVTLTLFVLFSVKLADDRFLTTALILFIMYAVHTDAFNGAPVEFVKLTPT